MSLSDADPPGAVTRRATRVVERVAAILPTVRGRLFALVLVAVVPALVILAYDEWLARERGFAALTDLSTRVVRLMQRELDDRITRSANRLGVLAADPDVLSRAPAAARKLVDALRNDRLYNNLLIADGATGDVYASAVPLDRAANAQQLLAFQRARHTLDFATGAFLPEPATGEPGLNLAQPAVDDVGIVTSVVLGEPRPRLGDRVHRALRPSRQHRPDGSRRPGHRPGTRSAELEKYVGKPAGNLAAAFSSGTGSAVDVGRSGRRRASCTWPRTCSSAGSKRAAASRWGFRWVRFAPT